MSFIKKIKTLTPKKALSAGKNLLKQATPYLTKLATTAATAAGGPLVGGIVGSLVSELQKPTGKASPSTSAVQRTPVSATELGLLEVQRRIGVTPALPAEAAQAVNLQQSLVPIATTNRESILSTLARHARAAGDASIGITTQADILRSYLRQIWQLLNAISDNDEPLPQGWLRHRRDEDGAVAGTFVSPAGLSITVRQRKGETAGAAISRVKRRHGAG
jgi:hypothetical protein